MLKMTREENKLTIREEQAEFQISYDDDGCSYTEEFETKEEMLSRINLLENMGYKVYILPKDE